MQKLIDSKPWLSLAATALLILTSCQAPYTQPQGSTAIDTALNPSSTHVVRANAGETFELKLPSNPTTGYSWQIVEPLDSHLEKIAQSYQTEPNTDGRVGVGGVETWRFKARQSGQGTLTMRYVRPWEKDAQAAQEMRYIIKIQ